MLPPFCYPGNTGQRRYVVRSLRVLEPGVSASLRTRQLIRIAEDLRSELPSMAAVARKLGVSRSYLSRLQSGTREVVGDATVARACTNLGLPRDYFDDPAFAGVHYRQAQRHGRDASDRPGGDLARMALGASAEALAHNAYLVLKALEEGAPIDRIVPALVSSARSALFLESHERVMKLLEREASEPELREAARAYALAMQHLGTAISHASVRGPIDG